MKTHNIILAAAAIVLAATAACSRADRGWSITGTVDGADGAAMAIEAFNNGRWYVVDSVRTDASGAFAYSAAAPAAYPEVMRITLGGASIYFPVDSIDHVELTANAADFARGYSLTGTAAAEGLQRVDSMIAASADPANDADLKSRLVSEILSDSTCMVAYYIINKSVGGKALFDPNDRLGNRIYGAVANRFAELRPSDPRTEWLRATYLQGRVALNPDMVPVVEFQADERALIDLDLYDRSGNLQRLADVASKGAPVLLSFTQYGLEFSPAYNVLLNQMAEKYASRGLQIYQVSFDPEEAQWQSAAANLPWIAVWSSGRETPQVVTSYNVDHLPLTYIINAKGELAERIDDPSVLAERLARYF